jgi:dienelactone hydrolase
MILRLLTPFASHVDRAVNAAFLEASRRARKKSGPEALGHHERMHALERIRAIYDRPEHFADPSPLFAEPSPIDPALTHVRLIPGGRVVDAVWQSAFTPHCADIADRYLGFARNRAAAARLFLHEGPPRPAALLIHGYRCGQFAFEERAWPVRWLFERGLDVALAVLPFHAVRGERRGPPAFPSNDPRVTNEGFRQAIADLRALARFLRDRGAPAVGAMGMSLGGYTTSLLATLESSLAFAVPIIPLASIADVARHSDRLVGTDDQKRAQHEALEAAHRAVSPFARPPRVAPERVIVVGAAGDQITPVDHARRLAAHFNAPLEIMPGGHLLQLGRADAFRSIGRMLGRLGLFEGRR